MTVVVQSKTIPVTQSMRRYALHQAERITKLGVRISQISVYLEKIKFKSNDPQAASVKYLVQLPGKDIIVKRQAVNMYEAIVAASRRAARQVRKFKQKQIDAQRRTSHKQQLAELLPA